MHSLLATTLLSADRGTVRPEVKFWICEKMDTVYTSSYTQIEYIRCRTLNATATKQTTRRNISRNITMHTQKYLPGINDPMWHTEKNTYVQKCSVATADTSNSYEERSALKRHNRSIEFTTALQEEIFCRNTWRNF